MWLQLWLVHEVLREARGCRYDGVVVWAEDGGAGSSDVPCVTEQLQMCHVSLSSV